MTVYADIPWTDEIAYCVAGSFGVEALAGPVSRLHGGEESAAASEFLAPLRTPDGRTVVRCGARPVTVWPYVAGTWADDRSPAHRRQAAALLARFHTAMATLDIGPPPAGPDRAPVPPEVADPDLDAWLAEFDRHHPTRHPLHGDYYAGNTLAVGDRIVTVLDWDEAYLGSPQREAAHAAWEWGDGLTGVTLDGAYEFLHHYAAAGGPGADLDETALRQLIRRRLRAEVRWARSTDERGRQRDADDRAYTDAQVAAFSELRPNP